MGKKKSRRAGSNVLIFEPPPPRGVSSTRPATHRPTERSPVDLPAQLSTLTVSPPRAYPPVHLDADSLRKVLRHAGPAATLCAAQVSRRWRRVALEILDETAQVNLSLIATRVLVSRLTYQTVLRMAHSFPNLTRLSMRAFPRLDVLPDVASFVMRRLQSATLRQADFSELDFTFDDLVALLDGCPNLSALTIIRTPAVNADMLAALAAALRRGPAGGQRTLDFVEFSHCNGIKGGALESLLSSGMAREVKIMFCRNARSVKFSAPVTATVVNMHGCENLRCFDVRGGALRRLNLSQCKNLAALRVQPAAGNSPLQLSFLNLSYCKALTAVSFCSPDAAAAPGGAVAPSLARVEEVLLSGARSLPAATVAMAFGLSGATCAMPMLRRIEAKDSQIERLRLCSYPNLEHADFSGCPLLNIVDVVDCTKLKHLNLSSRKSPMARVNVSIPAGAQMKGRRDHWAWQVMESTQMVTYEM